ncbi:sigma-54 interaction domain-containing protein [Nitrosococcus watsonii]|uniref:Sigma54 specific transcriptional regulator, Fis family n=1 Tax=Nitrosococcus watsoni (strain C-113) TaxID=105559 RepID=D8K9Q4_NITWC|nr:sigma-54 dependent transcriptional regulator [Nitrosococcus watsonii]ADJ27343.1 sigma54 specific transcriptional regulator, Fis family [Nitrosococcus watsonii C-113]
MKYLNETSHMVGLSKATRNLQNAIQKVAPLEAAVLLYGESGTGKELAARMIHDLSNRRTSPFISVNCGALPRELLNTELFGHEKGSFTGAIYQHQGYFEQADGGTLLLDEITEMPLSFQVYLLRALETGTFRRVGGHQEIKTNPRVIATTNIDPWQAVERGKLRPDLFFRLAEFPLYLAPLRDRDEDAILLAHYFLESFNETYEENKRFTNDALQFISNNSWPGNVRELRHAIHHAFILANDEIDERKFHRGQWQSTPSYQDKLVYSLVGLSIEDIEKNLIPATLDHFKGDKKQTAQCLGISLKTLYNRLNLISEIDGKEDLNKVVNFSTKNSNAFLARESD